MRRKASKIRAHDPACQDCHVRHSRLSNHAAAYLEELGVSMAELGQILNDDELIAGGLLYSSESQNERLRRIASTLVVYGATGGEADYATGTQQLMQLNADHADFEDRARQQQIEQREQEREHARIASRARVREWKSAHPGKEAEYARAYRERKRINAQTSD